MSDILLKDTKIATNGMATHLIQCILIWATSRENMSSEICKQVRLKPPWSATEASWSLETLDIASMGTV